MRKLVAILALVLAFVGPAAGQSRTAERILSVPFSQLRTTDPDGSVRIVINGSPTSPCTVGSQMVSATKLGGVWKCTNIETAAGAAPIAATYITQTPHVTLTNEQALSLLGTGLVKNTTGTGVLNIAVAGIDFLAPNGNGSQLTNLNASNLATGTIPDARCPPVLPTLSGINLTTLNASNLAGGTVPDARFPATLPAISGANLSSLNATSLSAGTVNPIRLGTGSGGATKFLREDSTWQVIPGGGDALTTSPLSQFAATTSAQLAGVISDESGGGPLLFGNSPTITTPTIGSFANSQHTHANAAGGGQITDAALSTAVSISKGGTGQTTQTAAFDALDPLTTKGDLIANNGTNSVRLGVGADGTCVKANSATATGLEYGTCGSAGVGDVTAAASFGTDNVAVRSDGTSKGVQASGVGIDDSANVTTAGTLSTGVGSSVAGNLGLFQGTATSVAANTIQVQAPASVTGYNIVLPSTAGSGVRVGSNSANVVTESYVSTTGSGSIARIEGALAVASGKTLTVSNTLTFTGTDSSSVAFGTGGTVAYTIASGTAALGTSAIASGACASTVTATATGAATTDVAGWGFNGDPTGVTGYQASANGMLTIIAYPSANNVNFKVCNNTSASVTPGAVTLNWRVVR